MNILYVTSEAAPFAASGGLGDVLGALPKTVLSSLDEASRVDVILPMYSSISEGYRERMTKVDEFHFYHSWRDSYCGIFSLIENGVTYFFVDNEYYFKRNSLYGQGDDGERFAFFSHAVMEFILRNNRVPEILHANDWQSALSVVYAKTRYRMNPMLSGMKTVFTIHNIEYQGKFGKETLGDLFDLDMWDTPTLEFDGCLNLLKGAMITADAVTTVSPNYRYELQSDFFAFGLQDVVRFCNGKMTGIINGIDTSVFTPKMGDLPVSYSLKTVTAGKAENKRILQESLGLPVRQDTPLITMITRLTAGKGTDLVLHILDELLIEDVQFVLLGTGDEKYERIFSDIADRHRDKARALIKFDRNLSKQLYAAADFFLMPSKSEPCGLAQMIACAYGTLPIVRNVGGLHDSITPYGEEKANGFRFDNFNAHDMLFTIKMALELYRDDKPAFRSMRKNAMQSDFTWTRSAKEYIKLYRSLL